MKIRDFFPHGLGALFALLFLFCIIPQAGAADISLAWDPSVSPNISGYKVYIGSAPRTYGAPIILGNQTSHIVKDLGPGTWYFAVTALDANGNESGFSNEVSQTINPTGAACDTNGDSSVDALDLQALANAILGLSPSSNSYDLNDDGRVDVLDLQILNNVILGMRSCP